jgi:histidinol-phosphate/aromatic aminotransferase/cobyric acid decarboxylase-like protein
MNETPWFASTIQNREHFTIALASAADRQRIYELRHAVYAGELRQHAANPACALSDPLDAGNIYLVAKSGADIAGFVSVTVPGQRAYSFEKYFHRSMLPCAVDADLFEIRLLTVLKPHRGRELATLLMYAAFRWVESHGGEQIVAIGRREVLEMYLKVGLQRLGFSAQAGAVSYELLHAKVSSVRDTIASYRGLLARIESKADWRLNIPFHRPAACFHGGAFFSAVGERFDSLDRHKAIINADVLDAWFDPSPKVIVALQQHLPWLLKTSPPTGCDGLIETIAEVRAVHSRNILPGAGSSDLIFRSFRQWLTPESHVLLLDPTYGEYAHVLEQVIGCTVDRLTLNAEDNFDLDLDRLRAAAEDHYDLIVLVNPNSPTGRFVQREPMQKFLRHLPPDTRVWIDETYIDYVGAHESCERIAAESENVIVCKSMSKVYALSGARVAYLCAGAHQIEALRAITPPWVVSLPAQVAAVAALNDRAYYAARYAETHVLRREFSAGLVSLGWRVIPGNANFVLCLLPNDGPTARQVVDAARQRNVFLRDAGAMGASLGTHALRVAVKDAPTNLRIVETLAIIQRDLTT